MDKLKQLIAWLFKKSADRAIELFFTVVGAAILAYLRPTPHRIKEFALATYTLKGWALLIIASGCAVGIIFYIKRLVLWYQTKHLRYSYKEFFGFKWEISPQFYNDGFRVSVEELSPATVNFYLKGPLCKRCSAECTKTYSGSPVKLIRAHCPICAEPCPIVYTDAQEPELVDPQNSFELTKLVYKTLQSQIRHNEGCKKFF